MVVKIHSFHIPVMGSAFSIDTPIKVAQYGISSVISLVDDALIEQMRQHYAKMVGEEYTPITKYDEDFRAQRIKEYLNLVHRIVKQKFEKVKNSSFETGSEIVKYFESLPENSILKAQYLKMLDVTDPKLKAVLQERLRNEMQPGSIDVNIMTKLDKTNYAKDRTELPSEYSDALAALRGYAESSLDSAIVFSAGINRRLYSYVEKFKDFYADATGHIKKKIILKVSDYRSSYIQGRFFAKKGLWVSEYRIESGLNCGGHAFASDGYLMGPMLDEFRRRKDELCTTLYKIYNDALKAKNKDTFDQPHALKVTAQGGIGTAKENNFLMNYFQIDGTGWATPFLLVPEVTNVDGPTLEKLSEATQKELYLSDVSPLGVPFNNIKGSFSDTEKERKATTDKPGSPCPKGHLISNTEFTKIPICTASRQYQKLKFDQLKAMNLSKAAFDEKYTQMTKKACICNDLGEAALIKNDIDQKPNIKRFSAICPGPNLAYFTKVTSFSEMVSHIYGRMNLLNNTYRPNMFINELKMYIDYFKKEVQKIAIEPTEKQVKYLNEFKINMLEGIDFYKEFFPRMVEETQDYRNRALTELNSYKKKLEEFLSEHSNIFSNSLPPMLVV